MLGAGAPFRHTPTSAKGGEAPCSDNPDFSNRDAPRPTMSEMLKISLPDGSVREVPLGSNSGGRRGGDRAGARQGGARGAGRRRAARPHAAVRGRCGARAGDRARRGGRARTRAPRLCACPGRGGAGAVSRHADHLRPLDRRRLLLRFRARRTAPSPRRTCPRSRRRCARIIARRRAAASARCGRAPT